MMFQASQKLRTHDELAVYACFVATRCRAGRRHRPAGVVSEVEDALQPPGEDYDGLSRQVLARVERIETQLADAPANVEWIGGDRDVVVSADPAGRLAGLWLSPRCTTRYSAVELEDLLNSVLVAAGRTAGPGANFLRDAG
jgi:hypothetical protein